MSDANTGQSRPFTGDEYLESLRDRREVWIYGQRVADVTTHPAFRNTARMIARLYDALHDPEKQKTLITPTDTGNGGSTHRFYKPWKDAGELVAARDAIAGWSRLSYGWMGAARTTKRRSSRRWELTPSFMSRSRRTRKPGTRRRRKKLPTSTTLSLTLPSIATNRWTTSATCICTSCRSGTTG